MDSILHHHTEIQGYYKFEVTNPDGTKEVLADWFPNLITNAGLDRMGTDFPLGFCQVGSGWGSNYTAVPSTIPNSILGSAGLTLRSLTSGTNDDGYFTLSLPWNILYNNISYSTCHVGTNSYVTFGGASSAFSSLSPSNPLLNKIAIGASDNSCQRLYSEIEGISPNRTYRIRYEGTASSSGTPGSPNMVWEMIFYEATPDQIDIQVGTNARGAGSIHGVYLTNTLIYAFVETSNFGVRINWIPPAVGVTPVPTETDTQLSAWIAGQATTAWTASTQTTTVPYYIKNVLRYRFASGAAAGNLTEVGVGWATAGSLFSRALILDSEGNPTTITIDPDQTLDVYYEFRMYPNISDTTGSLDINGTTYNWIGRVANIDTVMTTSGRSIGYWGMTNQGTHAGADLIASYIRFSNGSLGTVLQEITSGTTSSSSGGLNTLSFYDPYVPGTYERAATITLGLTSLLTGSAPITAFQTNAGYGVYQFSFNPGIPKDYKEILSIKIKYSWGRRLT